MANWEIIHMATKLSMLGKHCILFECLLDGLKTPVCEENLRTLPCTSKIYVAFNNFTVIA